MTNAFNLSCPDCGEDGHIEHPGRGPRPRRQAQWRQWRNPRRPGRPRLRPRTRDSRSARNPLWGQAGAFTVTMGAMRASIEISGMFGIASTFCLFPAFAARAVDTDRPFLSETGYRSFCGLSGDLPPGLTPDAFVREAIETHVRRELKGRLKAIEPRYR